MPSRPKTLPDPHSWSTVIGRLAVIVALMLGVAVLMNGVMP